MTAFQAAAAAKADLLFPPATTSFKLLLSGIPPLFPSCACVTWWVCVVVSLPLYRVWVLVKVSSESISKYVILFCMHVSVPMFFSVPPLYVCMSACFLWCLLLCWCVLVCAFVNVFLGVSHSFLWVCLSVCFILNVSVCQRMNVFVFSQYFSFLVLYSSFFSLPLLL